MQREARTVFDPVAPSDRHGDRTLTLRPVSHWKALNPGSLRRDRDGDASPRVSLIHQIDRLQRRLRGAQLDSIMALIAAVQAREPLCEQHSYHVAAYAERLGRALGLSPVELEVLTIAALLHDVGKIGIPDAILSKPGPLTVEEYERVKQHPVIGEAIIKPVAFLERERLLIRHHHEWFDGSGYPDGLSGGQIPLGARILQVADSIDAMVTPRSYKTGRYADEVIAELVRCRGTQFDPIIADIAIDWLRRSPDELLSPNHVSRDFMIHGSP